MTTARRMWQVIEPVHAVLYFAPELTTAATESGLASHGSTYFACRAAPLGQATAALVTAVFYGFSPTRVMRSVPSMWQLIDPAAALQLRTSVAEAALRRLLGPAVANPMVARAAELAGRAVDGAETAGRPLAAANAAVEVAGDPHMRPLASADHAAGTSRRWPLHRACQRKDRAMRGTCATRGVRCRCA